MFQFILPIRYCSLYVGTLYLLNLSCDFMALLFSSSLTKLPLCSLSKSSLVFWIVYTLRGGFRPSKMQIQKTTLQYTQNQDTDYDNFHNRNRSATCSEANACTFIVQNTCVDDFHLHVSLFNGSNRRPCLILQIPRLLLKPCINVLVLNIASIRHIDGFLYNNWLTWFEHG